MSQYRRVKELTLYDAKRTETASLNRKIYVSSLGENRISIIIPCHRVIGENGKLTGYGGGLWRKNWLLNHENKNK